MDVNEEFDNIDKSNPTYYENTSFIESDSIA